MIADEIRRLEETLLDPAVRSNPDELAINLADDFIEFGSSGRVYDKTHILAAVEDEPTAQYSIADFHLIRLRPDAVLATYRASKVLAPASEPVESLRRLLWVRSDGRWQMKFHQGTLISAPPCCGREKEALLK